MGKAIHPMVRVRERTRAPSPTSAAPFVPIAQPLLSPVPEGPGAPLDASTRSDFEQRFSVDFSRVRVHAGASASAAADSLGAIAYTVGRHVVLGAQSHPGTAAGHRTLAHELAHVVQQGVVADSQLGRAEPSTAHDELEADQAVASITNGRAASIEPRNAAFVGRQQKPAADPDIANMPWSRYVDRFQAVYYDIGYRSEKGNLSKWLQVRYDDGSLIDIGIDEIVEGGPAGEAMVQAMRQATIGRGGRIFPTVLNRETTPRLYAARRSALEAMDEYNVQFIKASLPAVLFIITTAGTTPIAMGRGGLPAVTRRAAQRSALSRAGTGALQKAEQIGAEIGASVAGKPGRMAAIAEQVSARGLSQEEAAIATEAAVRSLPLRTGPRVLLTSGDVVVTSVQIGPSQPVLVVQTTGSVFRATADLVLEGLTVVVRNVTRL